MRELDPEDKKLYEQLLERGTKEDLFEFGYSLGRVTMGEEMLKLIKVKNDNVQVS